MVNRSNKISSGVKKIGIIGVGVVGSAVKFGLARIGNEVKGFDTKDPETKLEDVLDTDLNFVCVPTPQTEDGSCDTAIVEKVAQELDDAKYKGLVVIKSTVTPGTTDKLVKSHPNMRFAFCPEFLREKATYTDFVENHDLCAIGVYNNEDYEIVKAAHGELPQNFAQLTPLEAEFTKYFSNVLNALKVVFANGFYEVCQKMGADYTKIKNAMVHRNTIANVYLDCNENFRGYGGNCLPKDAEAFARLVKDLDLDLDLFDTIISENKKFKTTLM